MCLMPIWPRFMKLILYYFTLTYIVLFVGLLIIRYSLWFICWVFGFNVWIFPRLNEDVGIIESFKPFITCEKCKTGFFIRILIFGSIIGGIYYVNFYYDVSEFVRANRQFMDDVYNGKLLDMFAANTDYNEADKVEQTNEKPVLYIYLFRKFGQNLKEQMLMIYQKMIQN